MLGLVCNPACVNAVIAAVHPEIGCPWEAHRLESGVAVAGETRCVDRNNKVATWPVRLANM